REFETVSRLYPLRTMKQAERRRAISAGDTGPKPAAALASPRRAPAASERAAEMHVSRVDVALGAPVADVDGADRRVDAGPDRSAEQRIVEPDVAALPPRVAELERDPREGREEREIADAAVVARADAHRVLADQLVLREAGEIEEPADAERAVERRRAADRRVVAERRMQRVAPPRLRVRRAHEQLRVVVVGRECPRARRAPFRAREHARARERDVVKGVRREAQEELAAAVVRRRNVRRVADVEARLAVDPPRSAAHLAPVQQLPPGRELDRKLAQPRLGDEPAVVEGVELRAANVDDRLDEKQRRVAERLIDVERERRLVADDERRAPLPALRVDRRAQIARREPERRVDAP